MDLPLPSKKFQRTIESFACENCGFSIEGDGYTDHCPQCLYSKHVDIYPGDRRAQCHGLMKPVGLLVRNGNTQIAYQCTECSHQFRVRKAENDNEELLLELSTIPMPLAD